MKCPNCSYENTADARFCEKCGRLLERACPNCGKSVAPTTEFCKSCGHNLASAATASAPIAATKSSSLDALRRAAPQNVARKILAERDKMEGERKLVTALFTDIVGSTSIAEQMDPEDWREVVSGAHRCVSEAVYRYEGTIAQLLGDGVLAFFGAPIAHEDDAERAIRAALDILASIGKYSDELRQRNRVRNFQMRVGVNSGLVVVGNIGSDLHMEYLAIGDTVNLAARMQSAAEPDTILISDSTHRLAGSAFEFDDRGKISLKGKTEPIQVYRVLSERKGAVRARGIVGLNSPMVGRSREFSTLLQVVSDVRSGRGSIVAIIGEAGLGKSRLTAEWRQAVFANPSTPIRWVEGRCLSYTSSIAHHLSTDILRAFIGVPAGSPKEDTHAALKHTLDALGADAQDIYPFLGHLLGLKLEEDATMRVKYLEGPALQAQYVAAYKKLLRLASRATPTVIICEDVHWADPSSVELSSRILSIAATAPIVFVFVTRPDKDSAGWRLIAQAHEISDVGATDLYLARLSDDDSKHLVCNLLNVEVLPESLQQSILAKTEGNPFFVEEVLRMLIDRGGIINQDGKRTVTHEIINIEIPETLQGVLTARIDRLPEDARRTLQIAAVIGRKFNVKVLERVLASQADSALTQLEAAQLVRRLHDEESAYIFKQALTQDAAYQSLLLKQRRQLHRYVAQAYEQIYPDRCANEYAAILAQHYTEAGEDEKAYEYRIKAGNAALRSCANDEIRLHYSNALETATRLPDNDENRRRRVDTIMRLVRTSLADEQKMRLLLEAKSLANQLVESHPASEADQLRLARVCSWLKDFGVTH